MHQTCSVKRRKTTEFKTMTYLTQASQTHNAGRTEHTLNHPGIPTEDKHRVQRQRDRLTTVDLQGPNLRFSFLKYLYQMLTEGCQTPVLDRRSVCRFN